MKQSFWKLLCSNRLWQQANSRKWYLTVKHNTGKIEMWHWSKTKKILFSESSIFILHLNYLNSPKGGKNVFCWNIGDDWLWAEKTTHSLSCYICIFFPSQKPISGVGGGPYLDRSAVMRCQHLDMKPCWQYREKLGLQHDDCQRQPEQHKRKMIWNTGKSSVTFTWTVNSDIKKCHFPSGAYCQ